VIADHEMATEPQPRRVVRQVAILLARLAGVVVFGYSAVLLGTGAVDLTTPSPWSPAEQPASYTTAFVVGTLGLLVGLGLLYRVVRAGSLLGTLRWLLGGLVVMVAIIWLFLSSDPLFGPSGPCSFADPLHVSCLAAAPRHAT